MNWWQEAVFYQIYPRSFLDTDGDGIGDLEGIRRKIPYLKDLGVDALWISPVFPSPMKDFGYDVENYCDIDPVFGTLDTFDHLIRDCHAAGLKIILDWVPNHSSNQHPWFKEAVSSTTNSKRDWYVWRDQPSNGEPPNNWLRSWSDEPAWTLDSASGQYYLHCFLPEQPDLNWANVEVRRAMGDTLRFWLDRGIDGFRMDVIHLIGKDPALPDDPIELRGIGHVPLNDWHATHVYLRELRELLDSYDDKVSVGEVYLLDPERVVDYYGDGDELHLSFNFASLLTPWRAEAWRDLINRTEASHQVRSAWPTWVLSNHDNKRVASRLRDRVRTRSAAVLLLTLRGSPFLYAGEELGLLDADIPPERVVDPGLRDGCRAPIPWTASLGHGWPHEPWLPFAADAESFSVEVQERDDQSMLNFVRLLLAKRHESRALRLGDLRDVDVESDVLSYRRTDGDESVDVVVNFAREVRLIDCADGGAERISSLGFVSLHEGQLTLAPGEAIVIFH